MALATTTLSSAVAITDNSIVVASATSVAAGRKVLIDQEVMQVASSYVSGTTVPVLRGQDGTATAAHVVTANVTHGLGSDFSAPAPQEITTYPTIRATLAQSITSTSTLTLPPAGCDLRVIMNGTSVITLTIPVPTKDMDGNVISFVQNGAAQHVYTFTGGVGGVGAGYTTFTTASAGVAAFDAIAANGAWVVKCGPAWTGTTTKAAGAIS